MNPGYQWPEQIIWLRIDFYLTEQFNLYLLLQPNKILTFFLNCCIIYLWLVNDSFKFIENFMMCSLYTCSLYGYLNWKISGVLGDRYTWFFFSKWCFNLWIAKIDINWMMCNTTLLVQLNWTQSRSMFSIP